MKILLLGHNGYLGSYLGKNLKVDILNKSARKIYSNGNKYQYIINCIGKPDLEYCESHPQESEYSNYLVLKDIKQLYPKSKIINFSSYYVYDDQGFCDEKSKTTEKYVYTKHKLLGEKEVENGVSFRLGKLFGNPYRTQNKLTDYIIKSSNLTLDEVKFNPTSLNQVLEVIKFELKNKELIGIYNLSNHSYSTHYEYGQFINKFMGESKKIKKVNKIKRQFDNYGRFTMSTKKLEKKITLIPWEEDLSDYLIQLNAK